MPSATGPERRRCRGQDLCCVLHGEYRRVPRRWRRRQGGGRGEVLLRGRGELVVVVASADGMRLARRPAWPTASSVHWTPRGGLARGGAAGDSLAIFESSASSAITSLGRSSTKRRPPVMSDPRAIVRTERTASLPSGCPTSDSPPACTPPRHLAASRECFDRPCRAHRASAMPRGSGPPRRTRSREGSWKRLSKRPRAAPVVIN